MANPEVLRKVAVGAVESLAAQYNAAIHELAELRDLIGYEFHAEMADYVSDRSQAETYKPSVRESVTYLLRMMKVELQAARDGADQLRRERVIDQASISALEKIQEILSGVRGDPESGL